MLWLAGLMGMMVLGSVAIIGTQELGESDEGDTPDEAEETGPRGVIASGTEGPDTLEGSEETDLLAGLGGDDLLDGLGGDDELVGGEGSDTVLGGDGNDTLHGDAGGDLLMGLGGSDQLFAHDGGGALDGGDDDDELQGGLSADSLLGGSGNDALHGREGDDTLIGGTGQDTLFGGWDDDVISGLMLAGDGGDGDDLDYLNGGDGDDRLEIGARDVASGGEGRDEFVPGSWIRDGQSAMLMDFDPGQDQMLIVYDDSDGADTPEVELRSSAELPGLTEVVLDGDVIAVMPDADAPEVEAIVVLGESAAALAGAA